MRPRFIKSKGLDVLKEVDASRPPFQASKTALYMPHMGDITFGPFERVLPPLRRLLISIPFFFPYSVGPLSFADSYFGPAFFRPLR